MQLFGPANEARGLHPPSSTTATPFTFTFTQIQTSDSEAAPFLKLPAELRNKIYELAAKQQYCLILFDGRIVLPPLGSVCKKIRTEMRGIFEQEAISNIALSITALVVNFDFKPLFDWLDEYDQRPGSTYPGQCARTLHIRLTCQPKLSLSHWFDESSPRCSSLGESLKKQRLQHLLSQNLMATMNGWSWELTSFMSSQFYTNLASPHRITRLPFFHANSEVPAYQNRLSIFCQHRRQRYLALLARYAFHNVTSVNPTEQKPWSEPRHFHHKLLYQDLRRTRLR